MKKVIIFLCLILAANAFADRFEFRSDVNHRIYGDDLDSIGIRDTIFIDQHIQIEDINVFLGIEGPTLRVGGVLSSIYSPQHTMVGLNGWCPNPPYRFFFWYDTDRQEDGPGQFEDYTGTDAYGPWELFCVDPFAEGHDSITWDYWLIEVIGTPQNEAAENQSLLPTQYEFSSVYPNPFNSETSLKYGLPQDAEVTFCIYNIEGRLVRRLSCGKLPAGYHTLIWDGATSDGEKVSSGVYMIKMTAGEHQFTRKAVLLK